MAEDWVPKWLNISDAEELSAFAVPLVRDTYPLASEMTMENFIRETLLPEAIVDWMNKHHRYAYIVVDGNVAGFFAIFTRDDVLEIDKLYILKEYRRNGLGSKVVQWIFNLALTEGYPNVEVIVADSNASAAAFYKKQGFEPLRSANAYHSKRTLMGRKFRSSDLFNLYYI